jgi:hypothetical protein
MGDWLETPVFKGLLMHSVALKRALSFHLQLSWSAVHTGLNRPPAPTLPTPGVFLKHKPMYVQQLTHPAHFNLEEKCWLRCTWINHTEVN